MEKIQILVIFASVIGVAGFGALAYVLVGGNNSRQGEMRELLSSTRKWDEGGNTRRTPSTPDELNLEAIKAATGSAKAKSSEDDVSTKLFKAGFYTASDRRRFTRFRVIAAGASVTSLPAGMFFLTGQVPLTALAAVLGVIVGYSLPLSWLERQIRAREEDVLYFLPLVIEQISIGVSSALDVGPCIAHIVTMATERDSHNPVTEMLVHVEKLIRSGLNLEDALVEVGDANGQTEVKHAFMFLAQCAKHGGELSKQLQELADAVMVQRQVQIEAKITSLPVKATGPLGLVFAGFFALLFAGLLVRLLGAFGQ